MGGGVAVPQVPRDPGARGRALCEEAVAQARRAVAEVGALARGLEEARGDSRAARAQLGVTQGSLEDERFSRGRAEAEARAGREARERLPRELEACAVREQGLRDVAKNYVEVKRVAASSVERVEGLEAHLRAVLQRGAGAKAGAGGGAGPSQEESQNTMEYHRRMFEEAACRARDVGRERDHLREQLKSAVAQVHKLEQELDATMRQLRYVSGNLLNEVRAAGRAEVDGVRGELEASRAQNLQLEKIRQEEKSHFQRYTREQEARFKSERDKLVEEAREWKFKCELEQEAKGIEAGGNPWFARGGKASVPLRAAVEPGSARGRSAKVSAKSFRIADHASKSRKLLHTVAPPATRAQLAKALALTRQKARE